MQEVEELCAEWEPEPLCPPLTAAQAAWREPVISSQVGTQVVVNGRQALNMASLNFLGIAGSAEVGAGCWAVLGGEGAGWGGCGVVEKVQLFAGLVRCSKCWLASS